MSRGHEIVVRPLDRIAELKTRRSRRVICLTSELVEAIKRHKAVYNMERLKASEHWTGHGLIFPTAFGDPSDPDTFSHLFSRLAKKAGLGHWHPHELRGVAHAGPGLTTARRVRSPRPCQHRNHQGRLRASTGG
ncbi:tyrosine-type recombinase/integrase [Nonomuraea lactucae]|uniref:tyrosine-type recombinase/integrase n=1 Tax=Nonomuraea lactucae TaxID=2249762 RepID=UPI0013B3FE55